MVFGCECFQVALNRVRGCAIHPTAAVVLTALKLRFQVAFEAV
ncbi:hypothetical protein HMPREF9123_1396 [Neisseria bacilliformis ATCC BAA-1200]|uniref:Uncharacterized protein n=1 Tax=Neisseria bacilliformis ATCC BAA-1200 TaxID=888742 RepID=F2BC89_9NEIS|nr:hypothetical protein HMPREF9123_1396 [Neisseria bacilliformis ATCC BAA-1200]